MKTITPRSATGAAIACCLCIISSSNAAFVVAVDLDPVDDGPISPHSNFSFGGDTTTAGDSKPSAAVGLGLHSSLFGGNGVSLPDTYIVSYTPGVDFDNYSIAAGHLLGSTTGFGTELASGVEGGGTGYYNVYFTVPDSTNVDSAGSTITATGDFIGATATSVDLNNGGTGADLDPDLVAFVGGAVNSWYKFGTVHLTAGNTYTFKMEAGNNSFVSQRLAGVMWEPVPEPSATALLGLGAIALLGRRRR